MKTAHYLICFFATLTLSGQALANHHREGDVVSIPLGQQGDQWGVSRPKTGLSKDQVLDQYGSPLERSGPIGSPAIYTWHYEQFKVYFENNRVIHSVVTR